MARKLEITVDYNVCVGNAMCEEYAPNVFELNEERQSRVKNPEGDPGGAGLSPLIVKFLEEEQPFDEQQEQELEKMEEDLFVAESFTQRAEARPTQVVDDAFLQVGPGDGEAEPTTSSRITA